MSELTREQVEMELMYLLNGHGVGGNILAHDAALRDKLAQVEQERDYAIAHDRQPYPTSWAYEQVCKALDEHKCQLAAVEAERDEARDIAAHAEFDHDHYELIKQRLAAAQAERDEAVRVAKALTEPLPITDADVTWAQDSLTQLDLMKQQLATAQNELCTAQDQIPPDMEGDSLSVALIKLKDQRRELQAEIARLKHELSQLLFFTPGGGQSP